MHCPVSPPFHISSTPSYYPISISSTEQLKQLTHNFPATLAALPRPNDSRCSVILAPPDLPRHICPVPPLRPSEKICLVSPHLYLPALVSVHGCRNTFGGVPHWAMGAPIFDLPSAPTTIVPIQPPLLPITFCKILGLKATQEMGKQVRRLKGCWGKWVETALLANSNAAYAASAASGRPSDSTLSLFLALSELPGLSLPCNASETKETICLAPLCLRGIHTTSCGLRSTIQTERRNSSKLAAHWIFTRIPVPVPPSTASQARVLDTTGFLLERRLSVSDYRADKYDMTAYTGYFYAKDSEFENEDFLTKLWYAGAYTVQTNTVPVNTGRQVPFESQGRAKRDRAVWPGDMGIAVPTQFVSTFDLLPTKNALSTMFAHINPTTGALPESGPPLSQLGSDTYHCWTMIGSSVFTCRNNLALRKGKKMSRSTFDSSIPGEC
ncbi:hypothetical protein D9757_010559 [Collybiopsis confluens]|uniref:Uncharacterized protein n=1 Tax=Collybiopsis confluens TaxID=2823264 RepID=A0A8H5LXJ7_9AGAR|nr:hypothetical protein D9757_010559 [Collybiopsis confluens]